MREARNETAHGTDGEGAVASVGRGRGADYCFPSQMITQPAPTIRGLVNRGLVVEEDEDEGYYKITGTGCRVASELRTAYWAAKRDEAKRKAD